MLENEPFTQEKRRNTLSSYKKFGLLALSYFLGLTGADKQSGSHTSRTGSDRTNSPSRVATPGIDTRPDTATVFYIDDQPEFIRHIDPNLFIPNAGVTIEWEYIPPSDSTPTPESNLPHDTPILETAPPSPSAPTGESFNIIEFTQDLQQCIDSLTLNIEEYEQSQGHGLFAVQGPLARRVLGKIQLATPILIDNLNTIDSIRVIRSSYLSLLEKQNYYNPTEYKSMLTVALAEYYISAFANGSYQKIEDFGFTFNALKSLFGDKSVFEAMEDFENLTKSNSDKSRRELAQLIVVEREKIGNSSSDISDNELANFIRYKIAYQYAHGFVSSIQQHKKGITISESDEKGNPIAKLTKGVIAINPSRILIPLKEFLIKYL